MQPKELLLAWVNAFNRAGCEALSGWYHERAVSYHIANEAVPGKHNIKKMFEHEFASADMVCIPATIFVDGSWAIMEWTYPKGLRDCGSFMWLTEK